MGARATHVTSSYHSPIESDRLDVVMTKTLLLCFSLSSCVKSALTTLTASPGSEPLSEDDLAVVRLSTSSATRVFEVVNDHSLFHNPLHATLTNENDNQCFFLFYHFSDHRKELLDQLS
jgi:hypothetical protein